jgi:hypothetical protein
LAAPTTVDNARAGRIAKILKRLKKSDQYSSIANAREATDIINIFAPVFKDIVGLYERLEFFTPATGRDLTYTVGTTTKTGKPDATIGAKGQAGILNSLMELEFKSGM